MMEALLLVGALEFAAEEVVLASLFLAYARVLDLWPIWFSIF